MADKPVLQPTAEHPIAIEPTRTRVTVRIDGELIADSRAALTLRESTYPDTQYLPIADVSSDRLAPSGTTSYCPYKGDAGYFHVRTASGRTVEDALWGYEKPFPAVEAIAGHVAFYPDKADIVIESASAGRPNL